MKVPTELLIEGGFQIFQSNYVHLKLDIITGQTDKHPKALVEFYKKVEEHCQQRVFNKSQQLTLDEYYSIKTFYIEKGDFDSFRNFITSVMWAHALPVNFDDWEQSFTTVEEYTIRSFYEKWIDPGYGYPS